MNARASKKLRREARRAVREATVRELRWWARPGVLRLWLKPATVVVHALGKLGWRKLAWRWYFFVLSIPTSGSRFVVRAN